VKMSISNPKIRFVSSADGVGFETLFVDVLLFSFQGSFVCHSLSVFVVLPTALLLYQMCFKVSTVSLNFF
ncbi:hypothetical protein, partial [Sporosarcina sp. USHLN248]|uniref:hypothetical protein n=1 Tax=Sporosarcina sp. USHLN248 TaxID=3081300 RepID=UPI00301A50F5